MNSEKPAEHPITFDLTRLQRAVTSDAAIRCITELQPVGHVRDKVFPPTYDGGVYAEERRVDEDGKHFIPAVLLDSVASQANRMEAALLDAFGQRAGNDDDSPVLSFPLLKVEFAGTAVKTPSAISVLEAPHRIFDAIFRDSEVVTGNTRATFSESLLGQELALASLTNATPLFTYAPTALLFGAWNSTKAVKGNAKFARALVSEIVGYGVEIGRRVGSRIDPMEIGKVPLYRSGDGEWDYTADENKARRLPPKVGQSEAEADTELFRIKKGSKEVAAHPSDINHGNVTPSVARAKEALHGPGKTGVAPRDPFLPGGVTMKSARQTTVLSLAALRRLRFPAKGQAPANERDRAARAVLAAFGLVAMTAVRRDYFLRSRCDLHAPKLSPFEIVTPGKTAEESDTFDLDFEGAVRLLNEAVAAAANLTPSLQWNIGDTLPRITPSQKLVDLIVIGRGQAGEETDSGDDTEA